MKKITFSFLLLLVAMGGFAQSTSRALWASVCAKPQSGDVTTNSELATIVDRCIRIHGAAVTCEVLDQMKAQGFKYSTKGAITISVYDMTIPPEKAELLAELGIGEAFKPLAGVVIGHPAKDVPARIKKVSMETNYIR